MVLVKGLPFGRVKGQNRREARTGGGPDGLDADGIDHEAEARRGRERDETSVVPRVLLNADQGLLSDQGGGREETTATWWWPSSWQSAMPTVSPCIQTVNSPP